MMRKTKKSLDAGAKEERKRAPKTKERKGGEKSTRGTPSVERGTDNQTPAANWTPGQS